MSIIEDMIMSCCGAPTSEGPEKFEEYDVSKMRSIYTSTISTVWKVFSNIFGYKNGVELCIGFYILNLKTVGWIARR